MHLSSNSSSKSFSDPKPTDGHVPLPQLTNSDGSTSTNQTSVQNPHISHSAVVDILEHDESAENDWNMSNNENEFNDDEVHIDVDSIDENDEMHLESLFDCLHEMIPQFEQVLTQIHEENNRWMHTWTLKFANPKLEQQFKLYFAHKILLPNQTAFLMLSLFYIVILFIFNINQEYAWISIFVHSLFIVSVFVGLLLTYTDKFCLHIHKITVVLVFLLMCGLTTQASLAEIPISSLTLMSILMVMLGMNAFLSVRYYHAIIMFAIFTLAINLSFILMVALWRDLADDENGSSNRNYETVHEIKPGHFAWFNMLLLFAQMCSLHLVKRFEIQERKIFIKILTSIAIKKNQLHRCLTLNETANIQEIIQRDQESGNANHVLPAFLKHMNHLFAIFSHLPKIPESQSEIIYDHHSSKLHSPSRKSTKRSSKGSPHDKLDLNSSDDGSTQHMHPTKIHNTNASEQQLSSENVHAHDHAIHVPTICRSSLLPEYYNPYPYLSVGYRLNYEYRSALTSIFQWHNETINMWTEILPLVCNAVFLIAWVSSSSTWTKVSATEQIMFALSGFLVLILRPFCSLLAHTFYLISKKAHIFWWRVDYLSICLTVLCEGVMTGYFTFECQRQLQLFFFICASCMFISTMFSTLFSHSGQIRAASFSLFSVFATGLPFIYQWVSYWQYFEVYRHLFGYLMIWTCAYVLAAVALTIKSLWFPERCCKDDYRDVLSYVGASHQIWHVLINLSLTISVWAWTVFLHWKYNSPIFCPTG